jgi:hypothetical protein
MEDDMPVGEFQIETYLVSYGRTAAGPRAVLVLYEASSAGLRDTAQLLFSPSTIAFSGTADNIGSSSAAVQVFADLPYADFAPMYDLVRNEAPVRLWYEYAPGSAPTKPLDFLGILSNSNERPGEGPADSDSLQALARLQTEGPPTDKHLRR